MSNRGGSVNRNRTIARNVRQSIKNNQIRPNQDKQIHVEEDNNSFPNTFTKDQFIKVDKILNLLNTRLKKVESCSLSDLNDVGESVEFDKNISLTKMNIIFSLMEKRISLLEKRLSIDSENIDLSTTNGISLTSLSNDVVLINKRFDDINATVTKVEESVKVLSDHVNKINIKGISNNFTKLHNFIQKTQVDLEGDINGIREQINDVNNNIYKNTVSNDEAYTVVQEEAVTNEASTVVQEEAVINELSTVVQEEAVTNEVSTVVQEEAVINEASTVVQEEAVINEASTVVQEEAVINEASTVVQEEVVINEASTVVQEEAVNNSENIIDKPIENSQELTEEENIKISMEESKN